MLVTLIMKSCAVTFPLPQKVSGRYWIEAGGQNGEKIACVDANGDKWQMSLRENIFFHNDENHERTLIIEDKIAYYALTSHLTGNNYFVFIEPSSPDRKQFIKYAVESDAEITIGRAADNTVCFENHFVSSHHAKITVTNSKARIDDLGSANGTYLNGEKVISAPLKYGDVLFICGLRLTMLNGFLAINNPDGCCAVSLPPYDSPTSEESGGSVNFDERLEFEFFRSPRFKRSVHTKEIRVDSPPQSELGNDIPILLSLAPAATMGLASLTTAGFSLSSAISKGMLASAIPALVMSICMLTGMVLWPTIIKKIDKKTKAKNENERQKKYTEYINAISQEIDDARSLQEDILRENYTRVNECVDRINNMRHTLWEREYGQEDFLCLRLGSGEMPMDIKLEYSQRKFSTKNDNLEDAMYKLCESPKVLSDVPITFSLIDHRNSGVVGRESEVAEFAKGIIVQLVSLHSYDEVKLVIIEDESSSYYDSLKWVPHLWNDERTVRFAASNESELKEISAYLEKELESRLDSASAAAEVPKLPYYIVLSFNEKLANKSDLIKKLYSAKADTNFSVIHFVDSVKNLPKECTTIVELSNKAGKVIMKNDISARNSTFVTDNLRPIDLSEVGACLANIYLNSQNEASSFPSIINFLQMFGAGKVEHLNCLSRWHENDPTQSLETAVGVDSFGDTFMLDLHEKFHGPHGLVAGMTGSGKSEFIMTFILSLAVNYHPNEVAFILIDYKGGGMAKAFENLPHVAGIITNLDGAAVRRALVSIESELKRRQALFVEASKAIGVSNIDIYKYQRLYREGTVKVPLQHLFIISDEFAELKAQQPDFMTQLISTARIGRSLGVHLILATQKPSGVVDDQIWSNSKFRICLKVQERADSMDMLKRPDAAELKTTGRFFLQVGYNELFSIGQSAWAGAAYYPADTAQKDESVDVEIIDKIGRTIKQAKLERKRTLAGTGTKQLDAVTKYIRRIADEEQICVKPLWLPTIEPSIIVEKLAKTYGVIKQRFVLNTLIGECDAPMEQKRFPLFCSLDAEAGNVIVNGISGSGKTTFITTLVCGIIAEHTCEEVNIYIVDYGAETLTAFSGAPQVGDVVLSHEREKADNLFKFLTGELEKRKKIFSQFEGSYSGYIKRSGKTMPQIVVVINNYTAFAEIQENKEEIMQTLTREGTKYGIYFVVSATGVFAVRMKLAQNFKQIFALTQNDTGDYAALVGRTDGLFPSNYPGRGLVRLDSVLYEFQTALPFESTENDSLAERIERFAAHCGGEKAPNIGVLPQTVNADYMAQFINPATPQTVPVGVVCRTLDNCFVNLADRVVTGVLSSSGAHSGFMSNMVKLMSIIPGSALFVFDAGGVLDLGDNAVATHADECEKRVTELFNIIVKRHNGFKAAAKAGEAFEIGEKITVFIESYLRLRECLSEEGKDRLATMLNKAEPAFGVSFVIGERVKNTSLYNFETWYKNHVTQGDGIWVGAGITEQFTLKPSKYTPDMYEDNGDEFGYILAKGRSERLKVMAESED